jgi:HAD superfamily phosphatase (TIGR01668 family)
MLKKFLPDSHFKNVYNITPEYLKSFGIKGIITDLDNTLIEWDKPNATPDLIKWFENLKANGVKVAVVSNNNKERVRIFCEPLNIPFFYKARKPFTSAFKLAIASLDLAKDEVCVVGDQLLTDILGGNSLGVHTILVVPVASTDGFVTRFNRKVERRILNMLRDRGLLKWEEVK